MAKQDFCFTYYDGDATREMAHMNRLERGAYTDVIIQQRQRGHLSKDDLKKFLSKDFDTVWDSLEWVLKIDSDGKYFIEWVEESIKKAIAHSERQKQNVAKRYQTPTKPLPKYDLVIPLGDENGNGDEEFKEDKPKKDFPDFPTPKDCGELPEIIAGSAKELIRITKYGAVNIQQIYDLWPVFLTQNITGKKYYADVGDIHSHFMNWLKGQEFKEVKDGQTKSKEQLEYEKKIKEHKQRLGRS